MKYNLSLEPYHNKIYLPVKELSYLNPVIPETILNNEEIVLHPFFNVLLKQIAACLSDIELAIANNELSILQFTAQTLNGLFVSIRMTAACRLACQMGENARKNQLPEVKNVLQSIKKAIGQVVEYRSKLNA